MNDAERRVKRAEFRKLLNSPAIKRACGLIRKTNDKNDGDTQEENVTKMPSPERVDAIIKICRGCIRG